jgi:Tol biopolymer transport system component
VQPESIAHYKISSKLGEGAMGEVYRATDSKLGREVAIKLIPEDFAKDSTRMARFTREAQVLASLNHPNIAAIYGVEDRALIMELVEGETLSERIKKGALPLEEALEIARQIADGLEAAHDKGIVHRDLKPANIKITPGGTVKLLDFGLAKAEGPWSTTTSVEEAPTLTVASTGAGVILGTAAYMAPEQARGRNVDKRADIWAFGVILYEMLTGGPMFEGDTVTDVLASVVRHDPDLKRVPERVRPLLERCLAKDPKKRLRDAGDAMLLLDARAVTTSATAPGNRTMLWALGGTAAVLAAALAWLSFVHYREVPPAPEVVRFQMALPDDVSFTQFGVSTISPDGRKVAFAAFGYDGNPRVWIRTFDSPTPRPLMDARISQQQAPFFWSADSRYVFFDSERKLKKIDVNGGAPELVSDLQPLGGSVSADGTILFGAVGGIMKISASGGKPTTVVKATAENQNVHVFPVFLPDGRHFLYMRGAPAGKRAMYLGDLEANPETQSATPLVSTDYGFAVAQVSANAPPTVLYLRENTLVAQSFDMSTLTLTGEPMTVAEQVANLPNAIGQFSASKTGTLVYRTAATNTRQLTWYNRQGEVAGRPGERAPYGTMKVSPDGGRAAVVQRDPRQPDNEDLWIVDLTTGASTRFTFDPATDSQPVWSPDGRSIAWMSNRGGQWGFYRKAADGSGNDELLAAPKDISNLTDWTHNGFLIFTLGGKLHALPVSPDAAGNRTPVPAIQATGRERGGYVSPDNRWIAYISNETGSNEIYVQPFSVGGNKASGKFQVSRGTRGMPRWRSDSKELMFVDSEGAIVSVDVAAGAAFSASTPKKLFLMPLELLTNPNPGTLADTTRDGERVLMVMPVPQRELAVVMNWQAGLKR